MWGLETPMNESGEYNAQATCSNCGWFGVVRRKCGTMVKHEVCENCHNKTLNPPSPSLSATELADPKVSKALQT